MTKHAYWWVPNAITSIRLVCAVPVFVAALTGHWALGFWVLVVALGSDFFDGMMARKLGVASPRGAELDAYADSALAVAGVFGLTFSGHLPFVVTLITVVTSALMISVRVFANKQSALIAVFPMIEVGMMFLSWTYIAWSYATLAYGWAWWYVWFTAVLLVVLGVLKRVRLRVWCAAILPEKWRIEQSAK